MKSLEILTAQNVTIEYQLAVVTERLLAYLIDLFIIISGSLLISIVLRVLIPVNVASNVFLLAFIPIFVLYSLVSEYFGNGQSWGKRIFGLKVVKIDGNEARLIDYLSRWVFRLVDIYLSLGTVGIFLISSTMRSQRLGDIAAHTTVIRITPEMAHSLKQIESMRTIDDYEITFPQVVRMSEPEMVMIKSLLEEARKYPNKVHLESIEELKQIVCSRLNIPPAAAENNKFLQTLINDYIVLTR